MLDFDAAKACKFIMKYHNAEHQVNTIINILLKMLTCRKCRDQRNADEAQPTIESNAKTQKHTRLRQPGASVRREYDVSK